MKPIYLEFCGINSFSEKTQIDFRALLSGGVFGIFGDTGSGKSTILDCIHLALYGVIERASRSMNDCIHHGADGAYVVFDFELTADGVRRAYRVRRERKRKNGATKAFLYELQADGGQLALAEGTRDVDERLQQIIGLSFDDFKMCIALPQGDFAALVKAPTSERVKLVSRLFDLEKYGERLSKTINEKYYKAEEEVNLLKAKMEQNEEGRDEFIAQKRAEIEVQKGLLAQAEIACAKADAAYEKAAALQKEKERFDGLKKELETLSLQLPEMEQKRKELERLPFAKIVKSRADGVENNAAERKAAEQALASVRARAQAAETTFSDAKARLEKKNFDEEILAISLKLDKAKNAEADVKAAEEAQRLLQNCRTQYKALLKKCPEEPFAEKKAELEKALEKLGEDDNLLDYLKHNFKEILSAETYAEIRKDLHVLSVRYPQLQPDLVALIEKYTPKTDGDTALDIAQINLAFKKTEQRRKELKAELDALGKREREFEANETQKKLLSEQGKVYLQAFKAAEDKITLVKDLGSADALAEELKREQKEKEIAQKAVETAQAEVNALIAEREKYYGQITTYIRMESTLAQELQAALTDSSFSNAAEAKALLVRLGDEETAKTACKSFFERFERAKGNYEETDVEKLAYYEDGAAERARVEKQAAQTAKDNCNKNLATSETELKRLLALREKYAAFEKELLEKEKTKKLCDELRALVRSNRFLEFIASEYLQDVCVSASKTLLSLTGGRYFLKYEKDFKVGDNLDGGNLRAVKTLSGGETFLVSLSLALSLSGAICQKSLRPIEFFFLDEGFGTLDGKLVDTVMDVLGRLSKEFSVGLISHVEELKHRIDNKILVTGATETHGSRVQLVRF